RVYVSRHGAGERPAGGRHGPHGQRLFYPGSEESDLVVDADSVLFFETSELAFDLGADPLAMVLKLLFAGFEFLLELFLVPLDLVFELAFVTFDSVFKLLSVGFEPDFDLLFVGFDVLFDLAFDGAAAQAEQADLALDLLYECLQGWHRHP